MSAVLFPHLHTGLRHAREVVMHPDIHTDREVLESCEYLESWGDWMDGERARALRRAIVRNSAAKGSPHGRPRLIRAAAILICAIAAIALLVWWIS